MFFGDTKEMATGVVKDATLILQRRGEQEFRAYRELWMKNRSQAILLLLGLYVVFATSMWVSSILFPVSTNFFPTQVESKIIQPSAKTDQKPSDLRNQLTFLSQDTNSNFQFLAEEKVDGVIGDQMYKTIEMLQGGLQGLKPLLDTFISNTPDVSGLSSNRIRFSSGEFPSSREFSNRLMQLLIPIYMVFMALEGFNLIKNANRNQDMNLNSLVWKHLTCILMLIIMPYILSYSIQGVNMFSQAMLGGKDLTAFLTQFLEKIQDQYQKGDDNPIVGTVTAGLASLSSPIQTFMEGFQAVLTLIPIILIALLYLLIIGQFIIRFIKLYFLAAIYPVIGIFYGSPFQHGYTRQYWRSWITTVAHQGVFVFGYAIVQNFLLEMVEQGSIGIEQIAIFIGSLLFLYNINSLTAELLGGFVSQAGDVFNNTASRMLGTTAQMLGYQSLARASAGSKGFDIAQGNLGSSEAKKYSFPGFTKTAGSSQFSATAPSSPPLLPYSRAHSNSLSGFSQEYQIQPTDLDSNGFRVKGSFIAHDQDGLTTLYQNQTDALSDNVPVNQTYPVNGDFHLQDLSQVGQGHLDSSLHNHLRRDKYYNLDRGIDGVTGLATPQRALSTPNDTAPQPIRKSLIYTSQIPSKTYD